MELRELEYFLAIIREESISKASRALHITQPALTRSLQNLEKEFGKQLIVRGYKKIRLTEDGQLLQSRAKEILQLAKRTQADIMSDHKVIEGDIYVISGETEALHFLTQAAKKLAEKHPGVRFHVSSGDDNDVAEKLERGVVDFGLMFPPFDSCKYDSIRVDYADVWGILMKKDDPLAKKKAVTGSDLAGKPLIVQRNIYEENLAGSILGLDPAQISMAATYSLLYNGSLMVSDGIGYLLGLDNIINTSGNSDLCFRPLKPAVTDHIHICWRRHEALSGQAAALLEEMRTLSARKAAPQEE
jgi:DNA-binding transcriptional LysR family regulator